MAYMWVGLPPTQVDAQAEWFEPRVPDTEAVPAVVDAEPAPPLPTEAEHRAALATIDLPRYPLELPPSRLAALRLWLLEVAQLAVGAAIGSFAVLVALYWLAQVLR